MKEFQKRDISFVVTDISESGEFEGYISTYYDVDSYGTYFMPGAWNKSIERFNSGEVIPVLWSHDRTKPIGKCTELRSDEKGLWAHGKLTMEDPQAKIAYAHMKDGSVLGLSVGFEMDYDAVEYNQDLDAYGIADADLMEFSTVVFPANKNAKITQVKSSHDHDNGENDMNLKDQIDAMNKAIEDIRSAANSAANSASDAEISKRDAEIASLKTQIAQLSNPITGTAQTEDPSKQYERDFHNYLKTGTALNLRVAGSEGTNANGGYICPDGLDKRVVELLTPRSTIRRNATIIQAAGRNYQRPYKKTGITSGWVGETTARTATDAQTYDMISATVGELYAFPQYTQNFLADTWYNFEEGFARDLAISFADKEETAFINGESTANAAMPNGILKATRETKADNDPQRTWNALQQVNTENATAITLNSLYNIKDSLNYAYRANAKWYMSTATYTYLQQNLIDGTQHGIFGRGDVSQNMPETLLGYPIEIDDYIPAVAANSCPIIFGDMRQGYAILERPGIGVLRDMYSNKPYIGLYTIKRVGGLIQDYRALKVLCVKVTSA